MTYHSPLNIYPVPFPKCSHRNPPAMKVSLPTEATIVWQRDAQMWLLATLRTKISNNCALNHYFTTIGKSCYVPLWKSRGRSIVPSLFGYACYNQSDCVTNICGCSWPSQPMWPLTFLQSGGGCPSSERISNATPTFAISFFTASAHRVLP